MDKTPSVAGASERELARLRAENDQFRAENESLRAQRDEALETLRAIRDGEVDALVVSTPDGERIFTLQGGDHPYRALIEQMREGAATLTPEGVVHYCNRRFAEMLNLRLERVMGGRIAEFVAPADRVTLAAMLSAGGGRAELTLTAGDGTTAPALVSAIALRDAGPAALCLVVSDLTERKRHEAEIEQLNEELEERVIERTLQLAAANRELEAEIDERKQVEEDLRESEERFRLLVEGVKEYAIFMLDPDGRVVTWNAGAERVKGYAAHQIVGQNFARFYPPEDVAAGEPQRALAIATEQGHYVAEGWRVRQDGARFWAAVTITPIRGEGGELRGFTKLIQDITERKRTDEQLQTAKTAAEEAQAAAEQANRAKDHFLAVLSHELRTPLTPVVMGVSMLQDRPDLEPSIRETLEMVRRNVELEARLIDDLLDVSRIARGKVELTRSAVELSTVIRRAVEVCKPDIEARSLHFALDLGPAGPLWVEADISRLQQVFWNLLKNAIKFTPPGGCVGVSCRPGDRHVIVEVSDSGMGIEPEALGRIFNAFEQTGREITQQFGGLGLGLAISRALVELHGGQIEARSEGRGQGATFRVRLPLVAPPVQSEVCAPAMGRQRAVRPLRVLLVEDHAVTAKLMQMVLTADGHAVKTAGDVATALDLAGRHAFDLLLSDLGLPDGSGYDLLRHLRQRGHKFPCIALSGYGQGEDLERSREAGFAAHLTKPASRRAVLEAVAAITAESQSLR